jgi:hypothetical protein
MIGTKAIACIPLVFATVAWASEAADRAGVERVIAHMNDSAKTDERSAPTKSCRCW